MPKRENLHAGHRERLRALFLRSGLDGVAPHNVLELLLFYAIPRRDTNLIAHALLKKFKTVEGVLAADMAALTTVEGVGEGTAKFLSLFSGVMHRALYRLPQRRSYRDVTAIAAFFARLLQGGAEGDCALLYLDNDFGKIKHLAFRGCSLHSAAFPIESAVKEALLCHAASVVVGHLHTDGLALPVAEDLYITQILHDRFAAAGVKLAENIVLGGGRFSTILSRFSDEIESENEPTEDSGEEELSCLAPLLAYAGVGREETAALLHSYGGLYRLLSATRSRHSYLGIGERLGALLLMPFAVARYCAMEKPVPSAEAVTELGDHLAAYYRAVSNEEALLLFFDEKGVHISTQKVGTGTVSQSSVSLRLAAEKACCEGAHYAVLAHNHPLGTIEKSHEDVSVTERIRTTLSGLGVTLLRHYIVGCGGEITVL